MARYDDTHKPVSDAGRKKIEEALHTGADLPEGTIIDFGTNTYYEPKRATAKASPTDDTPASDEKPAAKAGARE